MHTININSIDRLVIYGGGVILMDKTRDLANMRNLDRLISFEIENAPKQARKENLNRTDNYYMAWRPEWDKYSKTARTALYIHVSEVVFEDCGEYVDMEHNGEKDYLYKYLVTFKNATARRVSCEKMNVPDNWTLPEGAKWHRLGDYDNTYDTVDNADYNLVHWTTDFVTEPITVTYKSEGYHKIERDADRIERDKIAAAFTEILGHGTHISHYDVEKLLKHFDITEKKPDAVKQTIKAMGELFNPAPETTTA